MATPLRYSQLGTEPADATWPSTGRGTQGSGGSDSPGCGGGGGGHGGGVPVDELMAARGTIPVAGLSAFGVRGDADGVPPGGVRVIMVGGSLAAPDDAGGGGAAAAVGPDVDRGLGPLSVLRSFDLLGGGDGGLVHHSPVRAGGQAPRERVFHTLTRVPLGREGVWHYLVGGRRPAHVYNSVYRLSTADGRWEPVEVRVCCGGGWRRATDDRVCPLLVAARVGAWLGMVCLACLLRVPCLWPTDAVDQPPRLLCLGSLTT